MKRLGTLLILVLTIAAGFTIALSDASAQSGEARRKLYWQKRYEMVLARKATAEARIAESEKIIRKARQRERHQGDERSEVMAELKSAERELAEVKKLIAEFPDTARRAGVPPGWLREVEDRQGSES